MITYDQFIHMIGKLYSAVMTGMKTRQYRVRLHVNNYTASPNSGCWLLRLFGCLSFEEDALEAQLNRRDRYHHFSTLWTMVNSQVNKIQTKVFSSKHHIRNPYNSLYELSRT